MVHLGERESGPENAGTMNLIPSVMENLVRAFGKRINIPRRAKNNILSPLTPTSSFTLQNVLWICVVLHVAPFSFVNHQCCLLKVACSLACFASELSVAPGLAVPSHSLCHLQNCSFILCCIQMPRVN